MCLYKFFTTYILLVVVGGSNFMLYSLSPPLRFSFAFFFVCFLLYIYSARNPASVATSPFFRCIK